jgi:hypothetical protein
VVAPLMPLRKVEGPCEALAASMRASVRFRCFCDAVVEGRRDTEAEDAPTITTCERCGRRYRLGLVVWREPGRVRPADDDSGYPTYLVESSDSE